MAEPGPFEAFYASDWQQPVALWIAVLGGAAACLARRGLDPSLRRYGLALAVLAGLDAWLTAGNAFGIGALPERVATIASFCFVYAGDLRYLLLWEIATRNGAIALSRRGVARAAVLALIVPLFAQLVAAGHELRVLFLVYELSFCALTLALLRWHPNARALPWVRAVSRFVLLYYGLWAASDALILATGADAGFALRVVPNLLYYGGLVAAIALCAPRRE